EPHAGVAARALDDRSAGAELPLPLRTLDDGEPDPVLDRAAGIEELRLAVDRRPDPARHPVEPDERGPPDRVEHAVVRTPMPLRSHWSDQPGENRCDRARRLRLLPHRPGAGVLR